MRIRASLVAILLTAGAALPAAPAPAQEARDECSPEALAARIHEAMRERDKADVDINILLSTLFTRRVIRSKVADRTGCPADRVEAALERLEVATRQ